MWVSSLDPGNLCTSSGWSQGRRWEEPRCSGLRLQLSFRSPQRPRVLHPHPENRWTYQMPPGLLEEPGEAQTALHPWQRSAPRPELTHLSRQLWHQPGLGPPSTLCTASLLLSVQGSQVVRADVQGRWNLFRKSLRHGFPWVSSCLGCVWWRWTRWSRIVHQRRG